MRQWAWNLSSYNVFTWYCFAFKALRGNLHAPRNVNSRLCERTVFRSCVVFVVVYWFSFAVAGFVSYFRWLCPLFFAVKYETFQNIIIEFEDFLLTVDQMLTSLNLHHSLYLKPERWSPSLSFHSQRDGIWIIEFCLYAFYTAFNIFWLEYFRRWSMCTPLSERCGRRKGGSAEKSGLIGVKDIIPNRWAWALTENRPVNLRYSHTTAVYIDKRTNINSIDFCFTCICARVLLLLLRKSVVFSLRNISAIWNGGGKWHISR